MDDDDDDDLDGNERCNGNDSMQNKIELNHSPKMNEEKIDEKCEWQPDSIERMVLI